MNRNQKASIVLGVAVAAGLLLSSLSASGQQEATRTIRGQVLDENGKIVVRAIVHLINANTKDKWSVVTDKKGRYQFNDVKMNLDYKLYGEWREKVSRTRSISQFDTRTRIFINLRLQPKKEEENAEESADKEEKQKD